MTQPLAPAVEAPQPIARIKAPTLLQELREYQAEPLASEQAAILSGGVSRLWWISAGAALGLAFTLALEFPQHRLLIAYLGSSTAAALSTGAMVEGAKSRAHHDIAAALTTARPPSTIASNWLNTEARQLKHFDKLVSEHLFSQWVQEQPLLTISAQTVNDTEPINVAEDLGQNPGSVLFGGVPGAGKGVTYLAALQQLKQHHPDTRVMLLNPKQSGLELGTSRAPALVLSRDFQQGKPDELALWLWDCVQQFKRWEGPKLLIIDEMASVMATLKLASRSLQVLPQFRAFLSHITSMGDSERHWIWLVSQDCSTDGLGISSALRATLRAVGLVAPHNRQALAAFLAGQWLPVPDGGRAELDAIMQASEVNRAVFDGKQGRWLPMPKLENLTGWDRDTGQPVAKQLSPAPAKPFWGEALDLDYFDIWEEWLQNRREQTCTVRQACQTAPRQVRTTAAGTREAFRQLERMGLGTFDPATDVFTVATQ